jgi:hypothetical protein
MPVIRVAVGAGLVKGTHNDANAELSPIGYRGLNIRFGDRGLHDSTDWSKHMLYRLRRSR